MVNNVNNLLTGKDMQLIRHVLKHSERTIFHASTKEISDEFRLFASDLGVIWYGGTGLDKGVEYYKDMCFNISDMNNCAHSNLAFYKRDDAYSSTLIHTLGNI